MNAKQDISLKEERNLPLEDLLDLIKRNYESADITNITYLNWQYNENPFGKPVAAIAKHEPSNVIAGQYIVIPYKIYNSKEDKIYNSSLSLNTLTDKDFRGRGLFTKLAFKTYEYCSSLEIPITIGFPNNNSLPGFVRKLNFENIGNVPLLVKSLNIFSTVSELIRTFFKKKEKHGDEIILKIESKTRKNIRAEQIDWANDQEEIDNIWNQAKGNYPITTLKNFEYLKWRYNCPGRDYKPLKIYDGNRLIGFICIRSKVIFGLKTGVIIDQFFSTKDSKKIKRSHSLINNIFRSNGLTTAMTICNSNSVEYSSLKKVGFYKIPDKLLDQPFRFIFRTNSELKDESYFSNFDNWFLTFGDYDVL